MIVVEAIVLLKFPWGLLEKNLLVRNSAVETFVGWLEMKEVLEGEMEEEFEGEFEVKIEEVLEEEMKEELRSRRHVWKSECAKWPPD